jgi:hypothetical protein
MWGLGEGSGEVGAASRGRTRLCLRRRRRRRRRAAGFAGDGCFHLRLGILQHHLGAMPQRLEGRAPLAPSY